METGIWFDVLKETITVISGVILAGVSTLGGFYVKRFTDNMKMKTLKEDIGDTVRWAEQSPSFKGLSGEDKFEIVFNKSKEKAIMNGVSISDSDLAILVESRVKLMKESEDESLRKLVREKILGDSEEPSVKIETGDKKLDHDLDAKG